MTYDCVVINTPIDLEKILQQTAGQYCVGDEVHDCINLLYVF